MKRTAFAIKTGLSFCLVVLCIISACRNSSKDTEGAPKLSDSARLAQQHIDSLRRASYRNNDLSIIFLDATSQIMQAQMKLEKAQAAGNKPAMVDSIIINSDKGDTLYYVMRRMYMAATAFAETPGQRAKFDAMTMPDSTKLWLQKQFKGATPESALNTLTNFQNDVTVINKIVRK
jgi:hypothetical protein